MIPEQPTDLDFDFDLFFNIAPSKLSQQPQQQPSCRESSSETPSPGKVLKDTDTSIRTSANVESDKLHPLLDSTALPQQQQPFFNVSDWSLDNSTEQQQIDFSTTATTVEPPYSPQSLSDGYSSSNLSPHMDSPPLYSLNDYASMFAGVGVYGNSNLNSSQPTAAAVAATSIHPNTNNIPSINIPSTPKAEFDPFLQANQILPVSPPEQQLTLENYFSFENINHLQSKAATAATSHQLEQTSAQTNHSSPFPSSTDEPFGKQLKKVAHNAIEKRYRNNINSRIQELKNVVPALYKADERRASSADKGHYDLYKSHQSPPYDDDNDEEDEDETDIVDGIKVATKLNKATILRKATEYIHFLQDTYTTMDQENRILEQLIANMPGGQLALSQFLLQKQALEKFEKERLMRERQEAQAREKLEHQRILRERASQRAALAKLLPKQERKRPYRRTTPSHSATTKNRLKLVAKSSVAIHDGSGRGSKVFMAAFLCVSFLTVSPLSDQQKQTQHHAAIYPQQQQSNISLSSVHTSYLKSTNASAASLWYILRSTVFTVCILYTFVLPLLHQLLGLTKRTSRGKCSNHFHYANEVTEAWEKLYNDLLSVLGRPPLTNDSSRRCARRAGLLQLLTLLNPFRQLYDILITLIILMTPPPILAILYANAKPVGCPEELTRVGAWIRLNEIECLGANEKLSRFESISSSLSMLAELHQMKRSKQFIHYCDANVLCRIYATVTLKLEICLPKNLPGSYYIYAYFWRKMAQTVVLSLRQKSTTNGTTTNTTFYDDKLVSLAQCILKNQWLDSSCHQQVLHILAARNGFSMPRQIVNQQSCKHAFYSFALPYVPFPLEFVAYWHQLDCLKDTWFEYFTMMLAGSEFDSSSTFKQTLFSNNHCKKKDVPLCESLDAELPVTDILIQWFHRIGLALELIQFNCSTAGKNDKLLELIEELNPTTFSQQPSSDLLNRHQSTMYFLLKACYALHCQTDESNLDEAKEYLEEGLDRSNRLTSTYCIQQLAPTEYNDNLNVTQQPANLEASVFVLSTLAVHLCALKGLSLAAKNNTTTAFIGVKTSYLGVLKELVKQDLMLMDTLNLNIPSQCFEGILSEMTLC